MVFVFDLERVYVFEKKNRLNLELKLVEDQFEFLRLMSKDSF